jgi:hypothetical protein
MYYTSIDHFDDPNGDTVDQPYGKNAPDWTFNGIVNSELPRKGSLPAEQVSWARISHSRLYALNDITYYNLRALEMLIWMDIRIAQSKV